MKGDDNMALIPRLVPNKLYLDDVFDDFMFPCGPPLGYLIIVSCTGLYIELLLL